MDEATKHGVSVREGEIRERVRSYVTTETEFRSLVELGQRSARTGVNRDFDDVDAELRAFLAEP